MNKPKTRPYLIVDEDRSAEEKEAVYDYLDGIQDIVDQVVDPDQDFLSPN